RRPGRPPTEMLRPFTSFPPPLPRLSPYRRPPPPPPLLPPRDRSGLTAHRTAIPHDVSPTTAPTSSTSAPFRQESDPHSGQHGPGHDAAPSPAGAAAASPDRHNCHRHAANFSSRPWLANSP